MYVFLEHLGVLVRVGTYLEVLVLFQNVSSQWDRHALALKKLDTLRERILSFLARESHLLCSSSASKAEGKALATNDLGPPDEKATNQLCNLLFEQQERSTIIVLYYLEELVEDDLALLCSHVN